VAAGAAPTVLMLGADSYTLRACAELGIDVVVVFGPGVRDDGGVRIPQRVRTIFVDDQKNAECVLSGLHRAGLGGHRFAAVLTQNEYALVLAGVLAQAFGCRGIAPEVAVRFRDKWLQKRVVRDAGLRTARAEVIEDIRYLGDAELPGFGRAVLKPIAGVNTKLTALVGDAAELRAAAARFGRQEPRVRTFVVEEFIDGDEWLVDGVVFAGEVVFYAVATYGQPCLAAVRQQAPFTIRRFDPVADEGVYRAVDPVVRRALTALGLRDGVFHMELFHGPGRGEIVFGECAARRGAVLVQEEVHCKFNVDLAEEAVRCGLGRTPRLNVKTLPDSVGTTFLPSPPGTLLSCPGAADILSRDGVGYARLDLQVGSVVPAEMANASTRVGQVMMTAGSPGELMRRLDEMRRWFGARLVVIPPDATPRTLRAWQSRTWPERDFSSGLYCPVLTRGDDPPEPPVRVDPGGRPPERSELTRGDDPPEPPVRYIGEFGRGNRE